MKNLIKTGLEGFESALSSKKRTNYFKLSDGEVASVRFLQELDPESNNYNEDAGLAAMVTIANPPTSDGWKYKYVVPENLISKVSDWNFKTRLLINVLVDTDNGEQVQLWDTSKAVARQLLEFNNEDGTITDKVFKVKRSGASTDTTYILIPKTPDGGISMDKYTVDIVQPEDYVTELTTDEISRHQGEESDSSDVAGGWT